AATIGTRANRRERLAWISAAYIGGRAVEGDDAPGTIPEANRGVTSRGSSLEQKTLDARLLAGDDPQEGVAGAPPCGNIRSCGLRLGGHAQSSSSISST